MERASSPRAGRWPDARLAIIEDVITPGGGVIEPSRKLRQQGASIVTVLCVIDRDAGGAANLRAAGLEMRSLFMVSELERLGQSSRGTRVPTVQIRGVARHVRDARVSSVVP